MSFHSPLSFSVLVTVLTLRFSFFSGVKMGPMGMQCVWHNIITEGRKGEMKRRKGESIEIHCVLGVRCGYPLRDKKEM